MQNCPVSHALSNNFACQQASHVHSAVQILEAGKLMSFLKTFGALAVFLMFLQTFSNRSLKKNFFKTQKTRLTPLYPNKIGVTLQVTKILGIVFHPLAHDCLAVWNPSSPYSFLKGRWAMEWNHCHFPSSVDTAELKLDVI